jgi:ABC-type glycerol-3-phosphate transport system permease component
MSKTATLSKFLRKLILYALLLFFSIYVLLPLSWLIKTSLETGMLSETFGLGEFSWLPNNASIENYRELFRMSSLSFAGVAFPTYIKNSLIVGIYSSVVTLLLSILGAYGFSRFAFQGKKIMLALMLITQMISTVGLLLPLYRLLNLFRLIDTHFALILTYTSFSVPFCTWFLKGYFDSIPIELEEASMVDGCTRLGALRRVVFPLALPGIVATAIFAFLRSWNEYVFATTFIFTKEMKTLPIGLVGIYSQRFLNWGLVAAGGVVGVLPIVIIFMFMQRYLIGGLTAGSVKG